MIYNKMNFGAQKSDRKYSLDTRSKIDVSQINWIHFSLQHRIRLHGESFLRWGFLIWVLILFRTFVLILVVFVVFLTTFRPNFTSGRLQRINHDLE